MKLIKLITKHEAQETCDTENIHKPVHIFKCDKKVFNECTYKVFMSKPQRNIISYIV